MIYIYNYIYILVSDVYLYVYINIYDYVYMGVRSFFPVLSWELKGCKSWLCQAQPLRTNMLSACS